LTTFTPNQSLPAPELTDLANGPDAFNALIAALEPKLFAVYASTVDRAVRNPTPPAGSVSVLVDTGRVEVYFGGAWVDLWTALNPLYQTAVHNTPVTANAGTGEQVVVTTTFAASVGRKYEVDYIGTYESTTASDLAEFKLRWKAGSSLDIAGTQFRVTSGSADSTANKSTPFSIKGTITGLTTGTYTTGLTLQLFSGAGTVKVNGSSIQEGTLTIRDVGPG
jgi:hypothetical protein